EGGRTIPTLQVPPLEIFFLARLVVRQRINTGCALLVLLREPDLIPPEGWLAERGAEQVGVVRREDELRVSRVLRGIVEVLHEGKGEEGVQARFELVDDQELPFP